ncbi:MAG: hypothetical protein GY938_13000 [Ketobacter sp.]|nr:hypothetical protein [Ketobacter sp.]
MANPEGVIQRKLISWRNGNTDWPDLWMLHSIPNGYKMGKPKQIKGKWVNVSASIAKAEGLLSGVWDLCLPAVRNIDGAWCPGMYLETKQSEYYTRYAVMQKKNPNQIIWGEAMEMQGWRTLVYYEWETAAEAIISYFCFDLLEPDELALARTGILKYNKCMSMVGERSK